MKKSTTTIETCRTELTLTLWNKGNKETFKYKVYVFTPKAPITIDTAEKLVKQKRYFIPLSETTTPVDDLAWLNDSIVLDIEMGGRSWLDRELTADEWYSLGGQYATDKYALGRNIHIFNVKVTLYDKLAKKVTTGLVFSVRSFRPLTTDSIVKYVKSHITTYEVLLDIDTECISHAVHKYYISEEQAYIPWL